MGACDPSSNLGFPTFIIMKISKRPDWQKKIAEERIEILFNLAKKEIRKNPERSKRYVELARKIGMRYNVRIAKQLKRTFCKVCNTILIPGRTSSVRIDSKTKSIIVKCRNCDALYRQKYK